MHKIHWLLILLTLIFATSCRPETARESENSPMVTPIEISSSQPATPKAAAVQELPEATITPTLDADSEIEEPEIIENPASALPMLPPFQKTNNSGIGDPAPGGEQDPFIEASFNLAVDLPVGPQKAVVQEHSFGQLDEAAARTIADDLGFDGPLYVQQIAPEFAPTEEEEPFLIFTAFDGSRILNIGYTGATLEDRGVIIDYNNQPTFAETAPLVEAQLKEWSLLDFPYEIEDLDDSVVIVHRLINGILSKQNEFNMFFNHEGELNYFDYHPLRQVKELGNYPLQTAEMAWQQIQQPAGRERIRYQLWPLQALLESPIEDFVNPRSWVPLSDPGREMHLYLSPIVYEATDGSELRVIYGDFTLTGDEEQLAEIAAHLGDVLHVWGTTGFIDGTKTLDVKGWEQTDIINHETIEGVVETQEDGQRVLQSITGETFILPAVPNDLEDGVEVYASIMARRDVGASHPLLDWNSLTEKIEWPDAQIAAPGPEADPITEVIVDDAVLIYYTLYQAVDVPGQDTNLLFLPVWQFSGETDQDQGVIFWVPAIAPEFFEKPATAAHS